MNDDQLIGDKLLHRVQRRGRIEGDRGARGQRRRPFGGSRFSGSRYHQPPASSVSYESSREKCRRYIRFCRDVEFRIKNANHTLTGAALATRNALVTDLPR